MIVQVIQEDFDRARETLPEEAPLYMHQEFAANYALRRAFPQASVIKVDRYGIEIDRQRFRKPLLVYLRREPYAFRLSASKWLVRLRDVLGLLRL